MADEEKLMKAASNLVFTDMALEVAAFARQNPTHPDLPALRALVKGYGAFDGTRPTRPPNALEMQGMVAFAKIGMHKPAAN